MFSLLSLLLKLLLLSFGSLLDFFDLLFQLEDPLPLSAELKLLLIDLGLCLCYLLFLLLFEELSLLLQVGVLLFDEHLPQLKLFLIGGVGLRDLAIDGLRN